MRKEDFYCNYPNCENLAEHTTGLKKGNYCKNHLKVLVRKYNKNGLNLKHYNINFTDAEKEFLKQMRLVKNITFTKKIPTYKELKSTEGNGGNE